jgi:cytoskeletal protein CcmA (bactofilin family)
VFLHKKRSHAGHKTSKRRRVFVFIAFLALLIGMVQLTKTEDNGTTRAPRSSASEAQFAAQFTGQPSGHSYTEDVVIRADEVFDQDVVVYTGDIRLESGGLVQGNLVAFNGDITIETEGEVKGNVTALSGDADVAGAVGGDLVVLSGDINLEETAVIDGNLSVMHGEINRESGAIVHGNVVAGQFKLPTWPRFFEEPQLPHNLPEAPVAPNTPNTPSIDMAVAHSRSFGNGLFGFIGRLMLAAFGVSILILLTGLIYYKRPTFVHAVQQTLQQQRPLSFVVGLIINLVLSLLTGGLIATLCLAPVGLAVALGLAAINLAGWSTLALTVGQRLLTYAKLEAQPLVALLVGVLLLSGTLALGWTVGGPLRPLTYLATILITAFGSGAVVIHWLRTKATPMELGIRN